MAGGTPGRPVIGARPGITAAINGDLVAVEAWDDEGRPLVLDRKEGRLVLASTQEGFTEVYDSDLVTIIPGGGWLARGEPDSSGVRYTTPVVAWGLRTNGFVEPYIWAGGDGVVASDERGRNLTIWHPDDRPRTVDPSPTRPAGGLFGRPES